MVGIRGRGRGRGRGWVRGRAHAEGPDVRGEGIVRLRGEHLGRTVGLAPAKLAQQLRLVAALGADLGAVHVREAEVRDLELAVWLGLG